MLAIIRVIATIVVNVIFISVAYSTLVEYNVPHAELMIVLALLAGFNFGVIVCDIILYFARRND